MSNTQKKITARAPQSGFLQAQIKGDQENILPVLVSEYGSLITEDAGIHTATDVFGNISVSRKNIQIGISSKFGFSALRDIDNSSNGGLINGDVVTSGEIELKTGTAANGVGEILSSSVGRYTPGLSAQIGMGVRLVGSDYSNGYAEWGGQSAGGNDGILFGYDSTGIYAKLLKGGVDVIKAYQVDWNLDKLDGTGLSGYTFDIANGHIFEITFAWYGYGQIQWGVVVTPPDGIQKYVAVHQESTFGTSTSINDPNLRIIGRVVNAGNTTNRSLKIGGRQYSIIGETSSAERSTSDYFIDVTTTTAQTPLISFRGSAAKIQQVTAVLLDGLSLSAAGATHVIEVIYDGTLTGAVWGVPTNHNVNETTLQSDKSATAISGGTLIYQDIIFVANKEKNIGTRRDGLIFDLPETGIFTVTARTLSGTDSMSGLVRFTEEW